MSMHTHERRSARAGLRAAAAEGTSDTAAGPSLPEPVRDHLGRQLQAVYASITAEEQPQRLLDLIAQLETALAGHDASAVSVFRNDLVAALPGLRAFAMSLVFDPLVPTISCRRRS